MADNDRVRAAGATVRAIDTAPSFASRRSARAWAADGDVYLSMDDAEELGASLGILIGALDRRAVLAGPRPDINPVAVAVEVLKELAELEAAGREAELQTQRSHQRLGGRELSFTRHGSDLRVSPGAQILNLVQVLDVLANAVLHPRGAGAGDARDPMLPIASAWSINLGKATRLVVGDGGADQDQERLRPVNRAVTTGRPSLRR